MVIGVLRLKQKVDNGLCVVHRQKILNMPPIRLKMLINIRILLVNIKLKTFKRTKQKKKNYSNILNNTKRN